jgi:hypothetical protein
MWKAISPCFSLKTVTKLEVRELLTLISSTYIKIRSLSQSRNSPKVHYYILSHVKPGLLLTPYSISSSEKY